MYVFSESAAAAVVWTTTYRCIDMSEWNRKASITIELEKYSVGKTASGEKQWKKKGESEKTCSGTAVEVFVSVCGCSCRQTNEKRLACIKIGKKKSEMCTGIQRMQRPIRRRRDAASWNCTVEFGCICTNAVLTRGNGSIKTETCVRNMRIWETLAPSAISVCVCEPCCVSVLQNEPSGKQSERRRRGRKRAACTCSENWNIRNRRWKGALIVFSCSFRRCKLVNCYVTLFFR